MSKHMAPEEVINKTRPRDHNGNLLAMSMIAYTDGSCLQNNIARTTHVKAGFAFTARDGNNSKTLYEQIGPVITTAGPFAAPTSSRYKGAERGTSQTAELTGLLEYLE
jgi:ribonuclease HI